jgi:hypothetical protein
MHGILLQDPQESLKCLNKHIPHQFKKKKKKEQKGKKKKKRAGLAKRQTQSSKPVQQAGMSKCIPGAWDGPNTSFQPNGS